MLAPLSEHGNATRSPRPVYCTSAIPFTYLLHPRSKLVMFYFYLLNPAVPLSSPTHANRDVAIVTRHIPQSPAGPTTDQCRHFGPPRLLDLPRLLSHLQVSNPRHRSHVEPTGCDGVLAYALASRADAATAQSIDGREGIKQQRSGGEVDTSKEHRREEGTRTAHEWNHNARTEGFEEQAYCAGEEKVVG